MAVGAQQHAFRCLLACLRESACDSLTTDREALHGAVDVVELQRPKAPVVAAQLAPSSGLAHELSLDATSFVCDLFDATSGAPKAAFAPHMTRQSVAWARQVCNGVP